MPGVGEDRVLHARKVDDKVALVALVDRVAGDTVGRLLLVPFRHAEPVLNARVPLKIEGELLVTLVGRVVDDRRGVDRHRQPSSAAVPGDEAVLGGSEDFDNVLHSVVVLEVKVEALKVVDRVLDRRGCHRDRRSKKGEREGLLLWQEK